FSIYIIVGSTLAIRNNSLFRLFGYSYAVVPTSSMEGDNPDSLNAGDAVIIYNTPYEDLVIGDVIVYRSEDDNRMIIHRIVDETAEGFITKGDNNASIDSQVIKKDSYQGKYVSHFTFFGIGLWLSDFRIILLGSVSVLLLLTTLYQVFKIIWQYKKAKLEKAMDKFKKEVEDQDYEG
ncbi:MAG TPA: signal peptidase I, partial [Acholeplasmataceae bacterium]|nr:signal peptidase I [Acholeplasmataceae bacterium]